MSRSVITLSAYQTTAERFFTTLVDHKVDLLLDVRLHNTNQLCGFTKQRDLAYFARVIAHCDYLHDVDLAPSQELLQPYLHHDIDFDEYASGYRALIEGRGGIALFDKDAGTHGSIAILGTATKKRRSHAEVLAQMVADAAK
ncbi:DUF488 domain-containing protein [Atopobiaceae bacterium 24-176]